jgi:hypothetical protein
MRAAEGTKIADSSASLVTFVMRTKGRESLFLRALGSVRSQTETAWALVVVNDGGNKQRVEDAIKATLSGLETKVEVFHNSASVGRGLALTQGLKKVQSEFFVIHDDDDVLAPTFIAESLKIFNADKKIRLAGVRHGYKIVLEQTLEREFLEVGELHPAELFPHWGAAASSRFVSLRLLLEYGLHFPPIALMARTRFLHLERKLGYFDRHEDVDIVFDLLDRGEIAQSAAVQAWWMIRTGSTEGTERNSIHASLDLRGAAVAEDNQRIRESKFGGIAPLNRAQVTPARSEPGVGVEAPALPARLATKSRLKQTRDLVKQKLLGRGLNAIIEKFGSFDAEWYFLKYEDCRRSGLEALDHYQTHGFRDNRSPGFGIDATAIRRRHRILVSYFGLNALEVLSISAILKRFIR